MKESNTMTLILGQRRETRECRLLRRLLRIMIAVGGAGMLFLPPGARLFSFCVGAWAAYTLGLRKRQHWKLEKIFYNRKEHTNETKH